MASAHHQPDHRLLAVALVVVLLLPFAAMRAQEASGLFGGLSPRTGLLLKDDIVVALIQNSSGDLARDTVARLSLWDRSQVTEGYARAAEWIAERAKEIGLEEVRIEQFASDGKAEYFGNRTESLWKVKKGELWITSPIALRITSYDEMPMSLARNSTTANVEGELVDVGEGTSDRDYASSDVKGKIVLASGSPSSVLGRAVLQKGAAGVISSWSVPGFDMQNRLPGDYPAQVGWSGIQAAEPGQPGRFAFLISARRAQEIRNLLRQGPVRVRAAVEAELGPGSLDVVSGVVPGTKYRNEEVVITAHLDHYKPGANDNASGSGAILEMARAMRSLIHTKRLPAPLRTIRFMWVPEYNGTWAWFSTHLADPVKRVAELNFDMVGENVKSTNGVFAVSYSPDANPSFLNALAESIVDFINRGNDDRYPRRPDMQVISLTGSRDRTSIRMAPYMTGTDHELFNNAGIPGTTLGVFPDDFYHSSGDSIEQVDATQLHRAVVFGLVGMTTMAYADDSQAPDLAGLSLLYGRERAASAESAAARSLMAASKDGFATADRAAKAAVPHVYRRERAAIVSCAVFATGADTGRRVERTAAMIEQDQPAAQKRMEDLASARAAELGTTRTPVVLSDADKRAARLVPVWENGKQLTSINGALAKVMKDPTVQLPKIQFALMTAMTSMRARGDSELRIMGLPNAPATWVNGTRSILDIANAMAVEYAPMAVDALEAYFRAFEKAGAMKVLEK
jgi:hypothetical protein